MGLTTIKTCWTQIHQAPRDAAMEQFFKTYHKALLRAFRLKGVPSEDAEELVQRLYELLLKGDLLQKASPERGSFRAFLKSIVGQMCLRYRREAHRAGRMVRLEEALLGAEEALEWPAPEPEDKEFDQAWQEDMARKVGHRFGAECAEKGTRHHEVFLAHWVEGLTYSQVGEKLELTGERVKVLMAEAGRRVREIAREVLREGCATEEQWDAETSSFMERLKPQTRA